MTIQRDERTAGVRPIGVLDTRDIERAGAMVGRPGQVIAGTLDPLIDMAARGARAQAVERGVRRAGQVTFDQRDGMPVMPAELPGAGAFFHADEGYRGALTARYLSESRVAATAKMGELARQHAQDPDAFAAAARAQVEGWMTAAPEVLRAELGPVWLGEAAQAHQRLAAARTQRELAAAQQLAIQAHGLNVTEVQTAVERGEDAAAARQRGETFIQRQVALGAMTAPEAEMRRRELAIAETAGAVLRQARGMGYVGGNAYLQRFERGEVMPGNLSSDERRGIAEVARARLAVQQAMDNRARIDAERGAVAEAEGMVLAGRINAARLAELERILPGITSRTQTALRVRGSVMAEEWRQGQAVEAGRAVEASRAGGPLGEGVVTQIDPAAPLPVQAAQAEALLRRVAADEKAAREAEERSQRLLQHMQAGMPPADHSATNLAEAARVAQVMNAGQPLDYATPEGARIGLVVAHSGLLPPQMRAFLQEAAQERDPARFLAAARAYAAGVRHENANVRTAFERLDPQTKRVLDGVAHDVDVVGAPPMAVIEQRRRAAAGEATAMADVLASLGDTEAAREKALRDAINKEIANQASWVSGIPLLGRLGTPAPFVSAHVQGLMRQAILFDMSFNRRSLDASAAAVVQGFNTSGAWARNERGEVIESLPFMRFGASRLGINNPSEVSIGAPRIVSDPPETVLAAPYNNERDSLRWIVPELRRDMAARGIELPMGMLPEKLDLDQLRLRPVHAQGRRMWEVWTRHGTVTTYIAEKGAVTPALFDLEARRRELLLAGPSARMERERVRREGADRAAGQTMPGVPHMLDSLNPLEMR